MNEQAVDDREIDLRDLFRFIFTKWRVLIVWAILFALLLCGYKEFQYISSRYGNPSPYESAQESYEQAQKDYEGQLELYNNIISDYSRQLTTETDVSKTNSIMNGLTIAQNAKKSLTEPEMPGALKINASLSNLTKMAMIGAIAGIVLAMLYYAIRYSTDGLVHDCNEIKDAYGIRNFGIISTGGKKNKKRRNTILTQTVDDEYGLTAVKLGNLDINKEDIAVTGPVSDKTLEVQARKLSVMQSGFAYVPIGKVTVKPENLAEISQYRYALLIIKRDRSKMKDVSELMDCLNTAKINVLGYLTI